MATPKLRFTEFNKEWKFISLGELLTFKNGINAAKEDYGFGYKFINVLDIIQNDFITYDAIIGEVNISEKEFEKNKVEYGDILFQRSSETREEVGQANVYLDKDKTATFGGFVIRGKMNSKYVPTYINYLLKTSPARKEITTKSGGSTRYNVSQSTLNEVRLYISSLPEQQKIADFLSTVDKKIQALTKKKELLELYKKGVMQKIFPAKGRQEPEIRFKKDDGDEYDKWEEKKLGDIGHFFSGGTPMSTNRDFYSGEIPFIKSGEIHSYQTTQFITVNALENSSAKIVEKGDLIYALYGATSGDVAISKINGAINQAILCIRVDENILFLYQYLIHSKEWILQTFLQGGQGNLSSKILKGLDVQFPCLEEQNKIANFLTTIDDKINAVNSQIDKMKEWKKGLLQQLFV